MNDRDTNLTDVSTSPTASELAVAVNALNHEMRAIKKFYWWIVDIHPELVEQYVQSEQAAKRLERKQ